MAECYMNIYYHFETPTENCCERNIEKIEMINGLEIYAIGSSFCALKLCLNQHNSVTTKAYRRRPKDVQQQNGHASNIF